MNKYNIYNKSSEDMSEVANNSIDMIIFAPPYNIDTPYSEKKDFDNKSFEEYRDMMNRIICECARVLKPDGLILTESADTVYSNDKLIALSGLIQKLCINNGLKPKERHINFLQSSKGVELVDIEHDWSKEDYYSKENSHSNCHQWLVMSKDPKTVFSESVGRIYYVNYPANEEGHPCPFSREHIDLFLKILHFKNGMTVLEPFMGTSRLGAEVLKRGGKYIGYELEKKHFDTANNRLLKT